MRINHPNDSNSFKVFQSSIQHQESSIFVVGGTNENNELNESIRVQRSVSPDILYFLSQYPELQAEHRAVESFCLIEICVPLYPETSKGYRCVE